MALDEPIVLNGILALASRFDGADTGRSTDLEATFYHARSLELLIEALDKKTSNASQTAVLVAVVLAQLYAELDPEGDKQCQHMLGTSRILDQVAADGPMANRSVAEAVGCLHLRQAIAISIIKHVPLNIPLSNLEMLAGTKQGGDSGYANKMVYLFARLLNLLFADKVSPTDAMPGILTENPDAEWTDIATETDKWFENKPQSFNPLYFEGANAVGGKPFPEMWFASPTHGKSYRGCFCLLSWLGLTSDCVTNSHGSYALLFVKGHTRPASGSAL